MQDFSAIETMQTSLLLTIRPQHGTGKNISRFSTSSCLSVDGEPRRLTKSEVKNLNDDIRYLVKQAHLYQITADYEGENGNQAEKTRLGLECLEREHRASEFMTLVAKSTSGQRVIKPAINPRGSGIRDYYVQEGHNRERLSIV